MYCIYSAQFQPVSHLPTKTYQNSWKFDEVLTETKMHRFFETQSSRYCCYGNHAAGSKQI